MRAASAVGEASREQHATVPDTQIPVVAIVTYPANTNLSPSEIRSLLEQAGPAYAVIPGLWRKSFLHRPGVRPDVTLFECSAIVDAVNQRLDIYLPPTA